MTGKKLLNPVDGKPTIHMRSSALPPIRPEACDKRENIETLLARDKNSAILLTAIYYAHTRHGNCACTYTGVNEEARIRCGPTEQFIRPE